MRNISRDQQAYKYIESTHVVMRMKDIIKNRFTTAASLEILELDDEGKYMVVEKWDLYQGSGKMATMLQPDIPHDAVQTHTIEDIDDDEPTQCRETLNIIVVDEQDCTCGKWKDHKYLCHHATAYLCKQRNLTFSEILTNHVHQYYKMISMKEIYKYNMNPVAGILSGLME